MSVMQSILSYIFSHSYSRSERIHSIQQHFHRVQSSHRLVRHHLRMFQRYLMIFCFKKKKKIMKKN